MLTINGGNIEIYMCVYAGGSLLCKSNCIFNKKVDTRGPVYQHVLTFIPTWISDHRPNRVWGEIMYPLSNFNVVTVEVWEWISNFIAHFMMDVITHPCWDWSLFMLKAKDPKVLWHTRKAYSSCATKEYNISQLFVYVHIYIKYMPYVSYVENKIVELFNMLHGPAIQVSLSDVSWRIYASENDRMNDFELLIPGFLLYRRDRNRHGV